MREYQGSRRTAKDFLTPSALTAKIPAAALSLAGARKAFGPGVPRESEGIAYLDLGQAEWDWVTDTLEWTDQDGQEHSETIKLDLAFEEDYAEVLREKRERLVTLLTILGIPFDLNFDDTFGDDSAQHRGRLDPSAPLGRCLQPPQTPQLTAGSASALAAMADEARTAEDFKEVAAKLRMFVDSTPSIEDQAAAFAASLELPGRRDFLESAWGLFMAASVGSTFPKKPPAGWMEQARAWAEINFDGENAFARCDGALWAPALARMALFAAGDPEPGAPSVLERMDATPPSEPPAMRLALREILCAHLAAAARGQSRSGKASMPISSAMLVGHCLAMDPGLAGDLTEAARAALELPLDSPRPGDNPAQFPAAEARWLKAQLLARPGSAPTLGPRRSL
jgi:hypothetical protein